MCPMMRKPALRQVVFWRVGEQIDRSCFDGERFGPQDAALVGVVRQNAF